MPEIDLIAALREFERLNNASNPFTPKVVPDRLPSLAVQDQPVIPQERVGLTGIGAAVGDSAPDQDYSNELMQQYMQHLETMPVRNKPNIAQKIFGGLANITDPRAAEDILYGKFNRQMDDWKLAAEAIGKGATTERQYAQNERLMAAEKGRAERAATLARQADERLEISKANQKLREYEAQYPNAKFEIDDQGRFIAISPEGKASYVLTDEGQPVQSRHISDEQKITMQQEGRLKAMERQGEITRENQAAIEAIRSRNDLTEIEKRGEIAKVLKQVTPGGAAASLNRPESEAARRTRWQNNAKQLIAEKPWFAQFIIYEGNNFDRIVAPKPGIRHAQASGTPTQAEYDEMRKFIFDKENAPESPAEQAPIGQQPVIEPEPAVTSAPIAETPKPATERKATAVSKPNIAALKAKVEPGYVLITNGTQYGSVTVEDSKQLPEGWSVVK